MARKRTIDPDFWTDDKVTEIPWGAVGFMVGLISFSDDEGRLEWKPRQLFNKIVTNRPDVTFADVVSWMEAIARIELVYIYQHDGKTYAYHPSWHKHESTNRPTESKIPDPPGVKKRFIRMGSKIIDLWVNGGPQLSDVSGATHPQFTEPHTVLSEFNEESPTTPGVITEDSVRTLSLTVSGTGSVSDSVSGSGESARTRAEGPVTQAKPFARWFYDAAVSSDVLQPVADVDLWVSKQQPSAIDLLATYGEEQCKARALAMIRAISAGCRSLAPSLDRLQRGWDYREIREQLLRMTSPAGGGSKFDRYLAEEVPDAAAR